MYVYVQKVKARVIYYISSFINHHHNHLINDHEILTAQNIFYRFWNFYAILDDFF